MKSLLTHPSPQEDLAASSSEPPDNLDFFFFFLKEGSCWEPSCLVELITGLLIVSVGYRLQAATHWDDAMRQQDGETGARASKLGDQLPDTLELRGFKSLILPRIWLGLSKDMQMGNVRPSSRLKEAFNCPLLTVGGVGGVTTTATMVFGG